MNLINRAKGCLLGLACGDAVGTTLEFKIRKPNRLLLNDMVGKGKFRLDRGQWTDDTSMTICLAESLIHKQGFDPTDQLERYCQWAYKGHNSSKSFAFGLGKQTISSLFEFRQTGYPYSLKTDSKYSGNGSLMRLAPIPLFYFSNSEIGKYAKLSSKTTHASEECLQACEYFSYVLKNALQGKLKENLFEGIDLLSFDKLNRITSLAFKTKIEDEISSSGYVIDTLEAALWAFWHTNNFRDAILLAANLCDDSDTVAAVCGQLAGAYYGIENIPETWLNWLYRKEDIEQLALDLLKTSGQI